METGPVFEEETAMLEDKLSVLLVDDNFLILKAYTALLQSVGYTVQTAGNGVEALQSLREHIPDLIVSDLDMPVMSGFELLSIVRRRFPTVQVVAMSGAFAESSIPTGLCADGFYPKGKNSPSVLLDILTDLMTRERSESSRSGESVPPFWTAKIPYGGPDDFSILLACPDCFRSFPNGFVEANPLLIQQTKCIYCGGHINFSVIDTSITPPASDRKKPALAHKQPDAESRPCSAIGG
jgi:CheY-like chemotaxis protein